MADLWESQLYECSWGGIRLDVQSTEDTNGRVLAVFQIPHRDGSPVRDMGAEPRVTRVKALFFRTSITDDPRERFRQFKALVDRGEPATFVHPLSGSFRAYVGEFSWSAASEPRDTITADVAFHEDSDVPAVFEAGPGATAKVGAAEVEADAAVATAAMAEYNDGLVDPDEGEVLDTSIVDESTALARTWEESGEELAARDVDLALGSTSARLQAEIDGLEVDGSLELFPVLSALTTLHATLRRAAASVVQDSPRTFEITVTAPTPLYVIAQRVYGGAEAHARMDQLLRLNSIPNPARIEPGTRLRAMQPTTSARYGSARVAV